MNAQELTTILITIFLVPLCLSLVTIWVTRMLDKRAAQQLAKDEKVEKLLIKSEQEKETAAGQIAKILAENDRERERILKERWERSDKSQCEIKEKLENLVNNMHEKVPWDKCDEKMGSFDERLRGMAR